MLLLGFAKINEPSCLIDSEDQKLTEAEVLGLIPELISNVEKVSKVLLSTQEIINDLSLPEKTYPQNSPFQVFFHFEYPETLPQFTALTQKDIVNYSKSKSKIIIVNSSEVNEYNNPIYQKAYLDLRLLCLENIKQIRVFYKSALIGEAQVSQTLASYIHSLRQNYGRSSQWSRFCCFSTRYSWDRELLACTYLLRVMNGFQSMIEKEDIMVLRQGKLGEIVHNWERRENISLSDFLKRDISDSALSMHPQS